MLYVIHIMYTYTYNHLSKTTCLTHDLIIEKWQIM